MKYILDTNTAIYFMDGTLPPNGFTLVYHALQNGEAMISVISKIEILGFRFPNPAAEIKANRFVSNLLQLPLSDDIVEKAIEIRKIKRPKVGDSIIGATAIVHNLTLISRNEKDFLGIPGLNLLNPFSI